MTLAQPYLYWVRGGAYANTLTSDNDVPYGRCSAQRTTTDLLVRTYLHTEVKITTSTTSPPPVDWFYNLGFISVAQYSPSPTTLVATAEDGSPGMLVTAPLVFTGHWPVASPGRDVASWSQQKTESAKVYQKAPDPNSDFPCVQVGLTVFDPSDVLSPPASYHYSLAIRFHLETLWASTAAS